MNIYYDIINLKIALGGEILNRVILENEYDANKQVARMLGLLWICCLGFELLSVLDLIIKNQNFTEVFLFLTVILLMPLYLVEVIGMRRKSIKYFICISEVLAVGILYTFFTYQAVLFFVIPVIITCRYYSKDMIYFAIVSSFIMMILSTVFGCIWGLVDLNVRNIMLINNDVNGSEMLYTFRYIFLPRILAFGVVSSVCVQIISKAYSFIIKQQQNANNILYTQEQVIISFAQIIEAKSGETGQHVKRVSEYCRILAREIGFSREEIEYIRIASMMHDVGKLMIPSDILEKPGALSDEEFAIIKSHVIEGENLLHNAKGKIMEYARIIALEHHERWDGTGYLGMKTDQIHMISRIVAVADVFDALVSKRSYKKGWSPQEAYNKIIAEKGKHFSPDVVDAFERAFDEFLFIIDIYSDGEE